MRKLLFLALLLPGLTWAKTVNVDISDFIFSPQSVTAEVGDTVRWTNLDIAPHQITGPFGESRILQTGDIYTFIFRSEGTFDYACKIHPSMQGSVRVVAASANTNSDASGGASQGLIFGEEELPDGPLFGESPEDVQELPPFSPPPQNQAFQGPPPQGALATSGPETIQIIVLVGLMGMFIMMKKALA